MNIVFDFGAVLFTWRPVDLISQSFPQEAPTPLQAGHLAHAVFGHADWQQFDAGTLTMATVVDLTAQRLGLDHAVLTHLVESIADRLTPMADSVTLLQQLHAVNTPLYFLSNMPVPYARMLEQQHDFLRCFGGGIFSGDVNQIKPDPAIYQLLQNRYALEPAQTVFIDDLLGNVQAARAQGWHGIHFESAQQVRAQLQALGISDIGL
jgi:putative hydrolase of the HAD superfamily